MGLPEPPTQGLRETDIRRRFEFERRRIYRELADYLAGIRGDNPLVALASDPRLESILARLRRLQAEVAAASRISGLLSPWAPSLHRLPRGWRRTRDPLPPEVAIETSEPEVVEGDILGREGVEVGAWDLLGQHHAPSVRLLSLWSSLTRAMDWLAKATQSVRSVADVLSREQLELAIEEDVVDDVFVEMLNRELRESIEAGEGRDEWRERIGDIVGFRAGQDEMLARTAMHRAYHEGQEEVLREPVIADLFPYRQWLSTMDNRVRESHAEMNEKVYHRDSELGRLASELIRAYNCRCSEVPLTEDDARDIGIDPRGEPIGSAMTSDMS